MGGWVGKLKPSEPMSLGIQACSSTSGRSAVVLSFFWKHPRTVICDMRHTLHPYREV